MKIYLRSYFDMNLGDDLMIIGILKRYPNIQFYSKVSNSEVISCFDKIDNIFFISNKDHYINLFKYDGYLTLGGSVFSYYNFKSILSRIKKLLEISVIKLRRKKVGIIGSNFGPFSGSFSKILTNLELKITDIITVRDKFSYNYTKNTVRKKTVYADDIVFEFLNHITPNIISNEKTLGISCYKSTNHTEINLSTIDSLIKITESYLSENPERRVQLFSFDTMHENDEEIALEIYNASDYKNRIDLISYKGNADSFLSAFSKCGIILAIRFHSAILSEVFNVPFIPIAYSNKMTNYISDAYSQKTLTLSSLDVNVKKIIEDIESKNNILKMKDRRGFLPGHLNSLDNFINSIR